MKKTLLSVFALFAMGTAIGQVQFSYDFDPDTNDFDIDGWIRTNVSTNASGTVWQIASYEPDPGNPFGGEDTVGQDGVFNSFALVNYTSVGTGSGTISNWLITPAIEVQNGDVVSFYTRIGRNEPAAFADRLQLRMSTEGDDALDPVSPTDVSSFTTLLVDVNPNLNLTDYPESWEDGYRSATISGLSGPTMVKFAFRYFVTNGGPSGLNSDIIGIDTFVVDRPLATSEFFASNFRMFPNPASSVLNLSSSTTTINSIQITDLNGRIVRNVEVGGVSDATLNVSDLNSGMYFVRVNSAAGTGITKFLKN